MRNQKGFFLGRGLLERERNRRSIVMNLICLLGFLGFVVLWGWKSKPPTARRVEDGANNLRFLICLIRIVVLLEGRCVC